ncbi:terminus macrodomain insulation protein YfbV [Shewanella algae]|uniref:terminus macrodomain insulation protein YfbV n=1 Tax=Shewanella algae TaxID=38313 RepID=UPI0031F4C1FC
MSLNFLKTVREGHRYMKTWPMVRQLGFFFPEFRIIRATQLALQLMPVLAMLSAAAPLYFYGWDYLPQAIAIFLFFLSLPLQGYLWLGWRARHPLPLSLLDWGNQLNAKLSGLGVSSRPLGAKACYMDMAQILKLAFERLDAGFWEEL